MGAFTNWLKSMLTGKKTVQIATEDIESLLKKTEEAKLQLQEFFIVVAINMIASAISKCEFRTFRKGAEICYGEWYLWNYEPNKNQNSSLFLQEAIRRLLYFGECLVVEVAGQLIIAESFTKQEYELKETVFTDISRGTLTLNRRYSMSEVLYFRLYHDPTRPLLREVLYGYDNLLQLAIDKFEKSGGERGIVTIDAAKSGTIQKQTKLSDEQLAAMMQVQFRRFFTVRDGVMPLFDGYQYQRLGTDASKKSTSEVKDITDITREIAAKVAQSYNIPPALLLGEVAGVKEVTQNFISLAVKPITEMMAEEICRKRYGQEQVTDKSYLVIDTTAIQYHDVFDLAQSADKLLASGMYNVDELRRKVGDPEIGTPESRAYYITKNYTEKGSESHDEIPETETGSE